MTSHELVDAGALARANRAIMDLVSNIASRRTDLPSQLHILICDPQSNRKFGAYVGIEHLGPSIIRKTRTGIGMLLPDSTVFDVADTLLAHDPGIPLLCDEAIAQELLTEAIVYPEDTHYFLLMRPGGRLAVYTPYESVPIAKEDFPGTLGGQHYTE